MRGKFGVYNYAPLRTRFEVNKWKEYQIEMIKNPEIEGTDEFIQDNDYQDREDEVIRGKREKKAVEQKQKEGVECKEREEEAEEQKRKEEVERKKREKLNRKKKAEFVGKSRQEKCFGKKNCVNLLTDSI